MTDVIAPLLHKSEMKRHSRLFTTVSLIMGMALFAYVVRQVGPAEIFARLRALGWGFALILALSSVRQVVRTWAWLRCMTPPERKVGFAAVWRARLAGQAIGDLTAGPFVGEPLKVLILGDRLPLAARASSLAVENLAYAASSCLMMAIGTASLLAAFTLSESLRVASLVAVAAFLAAMAAGALVIGRRWPVLSLLGAALGRAVKREGLRAWTDRKTGRLRAIEEYIFDFYARRPADFSLVALCQAAFHLAGVAEVYLTLHLIGYEPTLVTALILESMNRVINVVFGFIPVIIGVDEAGTGLLAETLGYGAATGVTLAVIRKARMFAWTAIGLAYLARSEFRKGWEEEELEACQESLSWVGAQQGRLSYPPAPHNPSGS